MANGNPREGLKARTLADGFEWHIATLDSFGVRGNTLIPDAYLVPFCSSMIAVPYAFLWLK